MEWHVYLQTVVSVSYHYKNQTMCVGLVQSGPHHHHLIFLFSPWYSWKISELALSNNQSLTYFCSIFYFNGNKTFHVYQLVLVKVFIFFLEELSNWIIGAITIVHWGVNSVGSFNVSLKSQSFFDRFCNTNSEKRNLNFMWSVC